MRRNKNPNNPAPNGYGYPNGSINGYQPQNNKNSADKTKIQTIIILAIIAFLVVALVVMGIMIAVRSKGVNRYGFGGGGGGGSAANVETIAGNSDTDAILTNISRINGGSLPEITYGKDNIPVFIDGKFSEVIVRDFSTAIRAVNEIKGLMHISNTAAEYTGLDIYETGDSRVYKLQQVVNDVPVYGKQLLVETDNDGKITALCCDYDEGINISTVASSNQQAAEAVVRGGSEGYTTIYSGKLCIYNLTGEPILTWCIDAGTEQMPCKRFFISASDNSLVGAIDLFDYDDATGTDMNGVSRTFGVTRGEGGYRMTDSERGISVSDCGGSGVGSVAVSADNVWTNSVIISAAANIREVYDYYKNTLNKPAFRAGHLAKTDVMTSYRPFDDTLSNAMCVMKDGNAIILFGEGNNYVKGMDVAAHEFTHAVIRSTCDFVPLNESGAISEAYCDIMGTLIRNVKTGSNEWRYGMELSSGPRHNISNPNKTKQPAKLSSMYVENYCTQKHDHAAGNCDNGGIHTNSGIICRASYQMYKNGISDYEELLKIFARSTNCLVPTADYKTCRAAILHSARRLGADENKLGMISDAFKSVEIENDTQIAISDSGASDTAAAAAAPEAGSGTLTGKVLAAGTVNPINEAQINTVSMSGSDYHQNTTTNSNGLFNQTIAAGTYRVNVSKQGYRSCVINNVTVAENNTTYLENAVLLTEVSGNPLSKASGRITDAVSGSPVSGAKVRFMADWGQTTGEYAKDSSGNTIELVTDTDGSFFTDQLGYGYYTSEVTRQGYATVRVNMIASTDGSISAAQNVVLAPQADGNDYRVTLEWGDNPRDEDAHIKGDLPTSFHVYYSNKSAMYDGVTIARLDHDDTSGNGFETITFKADEGGKYRYFVHKYAGEGSLSNSNARVKLYRGDVMIEQFNVPADQGDGRYWNVFKIENGQVIPVNTIVNQEPE